MYIRYFTPNLPMYDPLVFLHLVRADGSGSQMMTGAIDHLLEQYLRQRMPEASAEEIRLTKALWLIEAKLERCRAAEAPREESGRGITEAAAQATGLRTPRSCYRPEIARQLCDYLSNHEIRSKDFAARIGTTSRTLRKFITTGRAKHSIVHSIITAISSK
jgi:hypothetical protein